MKTSRKKLTIAAPRGFCAGVDRAVANPLRPGRDAMGRVRAGRVLQAGQLGPALRLHRQGLQVQVWRRARRGRREDV